MADDNFAKKLYVRLYAYEADVFESLKEKFGKSKDSDMAKILICDFEKYYDKSKELEIENRRLKNELQELNDKMKRVKSTFELINSF